MKNIAKDLLKAIDCFYKEFITLDDNITSIRLAEEKWSLKEILGHLIDSASNNHQRFIRLQLSDSLQFSDYKRDEWLDIQKHNNADFKDLLSLFLYYNRLIAHIISNINEKCLNNRWNINWADNTPYITLDKLIIHYIDHLNGHITHFKERLAEIIKLSDASLQ